MTESKKTKLTEQIQIIVNQLYYCYNNSPDTITIIERFVNNQVVKIDNKKAQKENKNPGELRNDLPGFAMIKGNKIWFKILF